MLDSIGDALTLTAGKYPDATAIVNHGGSRLTYRELDERVNRLANGLMALGLGRGDKIAYLFLNCSQFVETHYAVAKIGAVGVPLNFRLAGPELVYQVNDCDAAAVVCGPEFTEALAAIRPRLEKVAHFICDGPAADGMIAYEALIGQYSPRHPGIPVSLYDENLILYTAGTTGFPKGSILTHKNSLFNAMTMIMDYGFRREEVYQVIPPLFHSASLNAISTPAILSGARMVLHRQFTPESALAAIQEEKITVTWGPATLLRMLIGFPEFDQYDTRSVRLVINGAMYMPADMRRQVLARFTAARIADTYGMTEASPCTTILPPETALEKPASVGLPLTLCDVQIFNDDGEALPPGEVGEIVNRGNFMKGYYKREAETKAAIRGGWFYTGDLGKKDEEGFIYLVDRKKDMICSGGENVYSKEVEEALALHPDVFEVAVIGLPDDRWGEVVTAVVAPMPGSEVNADALEAHCREKIAAYKCPKVFKFVETLPKNPAGKVLKRDLKKTFGPQA